MNTVKTIFQNRTHKEQNPKKSNLDNETKQITTKTKTLNFFPKDQTFMTKTPKKKKKNRAPLFIPSSPQQLEQRPQQPHRLQDQKKQQQQEQQHHQHQYS